MTVDIPSEKRALLGNNGGVNIAVWRMHSSRMSSTVKKSRFVSIGSVRKDTSINRCMREVKEGASRRREYWATSDVESRETGSNSTQRETWESAVNGGGH